MGLASPFRRPCDYALAAFIALGPMLALAARASADEVHLVGGNRIDGNVTQQGDKVVIRLESRQIALPASSVLLIEHKPSALDGASALEAKLKPGDVAGLLLLADYCRDNDLPARERESLERILEIDPDHAGARARLGYVKREGRWITREEQMRADGFVREAGQWLSREQAAELERMRAARELADRERERARAAEQQQQLEQDRLQQELAAEARRMAAEPYYGGYYPLAYYPPYWLRPPRPCFRGGCDRPQASPVRPPEPSPSAPARTHEPPPALAARGARAATSVLSVSRPH